MLESTTKPLEGLKVAILVYDNFFFDPRSKKNVSWLVDAGATVTVLAVAQEIDKTYEQKNCSFELMGMVSKYKTSKSKIRLIRIGLNLTYFKIRNFIVGYPERKDRETFLTEKFAQKTIECNPDVIIAVNAFTLGAALQASEALHVPFIYDAHEFWPDYGWDPKIKFSQKQRKSLAKFEEQGIKKAATTITVSDYLAEETKRIFDINTPEIIYNAPLTKIEKTTPCHSPVRLIFQGNLTVGRNLLTLLKAMPMIENAVLTFQGEGPRKNQLIELSKKLKLDDRVKFIPPVPYSQVSRAASMHDVGIACHKGYNRQMDGGLPNKLFDGFAGGIAMAVTPTKAFCMLESAKDAMYFVDPESPETIARDLNKLVSNPEKITEMKKRALEIADSYTGEAQSRVLVNIVLGALEK